MSDAVYVNQAADWARDLTLRESRGPGDIDNAWRRLEVRYGIPTSAFWSLRYRRPKTIATALYFRLRQAYQSEQERQMRKLRHEMAIAEKIAGPDNAAVLAIEALVEHAPGPGTVSEDDAEWT